MWIFSGWHNNSHNVRISIGEGFAADQNRMLRFRVQARKFVGSMGPGIYRCGLYHEKEIESAIWVTETVT